MKKICIIILILSLLPASAAAQSKSFDLSKWVTLHSSLLKELNLHYVDSLPVDRIEKEGVKAMLQALDPYTVYIPEEDNEDFEMMINNSYGGIGAIIYKPEIKGNVIINEPYADSPAARSGLRCGDEIISVDGVSVSGLSSREASDRMKGKPGSTVVFKVKKLRSTDTTEIKIVREKIKIPNVTYSDVLEDGTGYIQLAGFTEGDAREVRAEVARLLRECGAKRLLLDLRGNGGGLLSEAVKIVSIFVPKGSLVVTSKGRFKEAFREYRTETEPVDTKVPLAVLVDSGSASASEIVSGALQDLDRATIFGRRTFGKGLVQSVRPLPFSGQLKITTAKYYTPSGRCVQAIDYAHRNEDGSVGHIPDSLTHEFRTAAGRTVRDGGGITPDIKIEAREYGRVTYSLVWSGIIEQYVLDFVRRHESIPAVEDFHFTDFEDFVSFASGREFDARSSSKTYFDMMEKEIEKDGLKEAFREQLDALRSSLNMKKADMLRLKKDEIIPLIEKEIVVRYYFQRPGQEIGLRSDAELKTALTTPWLF